ncbi:glycosyltransferase family 9 protein [Maridesulfovibrio hydrothermalis]|uniref:Glycosyl transferase family 9 n=1 Tax=Maridesulfovibrio hydrothermalis AM13 = DSM 14728 TaxID=1121451 RepID=L0R7B4_9BACT|nr:glycosyltransferase family 9 protein [Maridesulfovibrio hydrothermalis]CCO22080.1 Glycosyl transferase family 9 [Maridesulfovibrio hydrothermalis AM13 = DSM 14728]
MRAMIDNNKHKVIFRLSALGDVVLTTGVIQYWADKFGYTFTVITKRSNAAILENNPHIKNIIRLDKKDLGDLAWIKKSGEIAKEYEGCELIDLHATLRSMILAARWKGKISKYKKFSMERRIFKLTRSVRLEKILSGKRVTERYSAALEATTPSADKLLPHIFLTDSEIDCAQLLIDEHNLSKKFVALHPYATHPDKAWPREYWSKLITLLDQNNIKWIIIGKDDSIFEATKQECNFTNQLSLRETCALLSKAELLVSGDSGPMHLAAGVQTPVIAMFGPTSKAWGFYPAGPKDVVLESDMDCRPCSLHGKSNCKKEQECLRRIKPEEVLKKILTL